MCHPCSAVTLYKDLVLSSLCQGQKTGRGDRQGHAGYEADGEGAQACGNGFVGRTRTLGMARALWKYMGQCGYRQVKEKLKSDVLRKEGAGHGGVHLSSHRSGGQEQSDFQAIMGYIARICLKGQQPN